ncbi:MAG: cytochrome c3 family protein [Gemmatimonadota bacterium]
MMTPLHLRRALLPGSFLAIVLLLPRPAAAQLISPGKLSSAHADLEGIRNCTQCHELRKAGISPPLCLSCHKLLADRIREGEGYHASTDVSGKNCAECHKEHFGLDFALVRLDTASFDHGRSGYKLEGRHAAQSCRTCHKPSLITDPAVRADRSRHNALARTYLGLPTRCSSCHEADSPHGTQFTGQACTACHDVGGWKGAREFDHDRTKFRLTGRHRDVACAKCHKGVARRGKAQPYVRYAGLAADRCTDCHRDPHAGVMRGACTSCHATSGWHNVNRRRVEASFDHERTGFALEGHHASITCASCHSARVARTLKGIRIRFKRGTERQSFPSPLASRCLSCHRDEHNGVFGDEKGGGDCGGCHRQTTWLPVQYDAARHNRDADFKLVGAHLTVPCDACHRPTGKVADFRLKASACADCHQSKNPHGDQFAGRACDACHNQDSFRIAHFDHSATRFPLDGAHAGAPCAACHKPEKTASGGTMVRYRPLGTKCEDCHGGST